MSWSREDQKIADAAFRERRRNRTDIIIPNRKICSKCLIEKSSNDFSKDKVSKDGLEFWCKLCTKESNDIWKVKNWFKKLIHTARSTSKKYSLTFDLDDNFVLELWQKQNGKCYWLNIDLIPTSGKRSLTSPSLDRLDCNKGYTKDNVVLSSQFANLGRCDVDENTFRNFCDLIKIKT